MTIVGIKVKPRKSAMKDLRDPEVVRQIREDAERAVRDERTRRHLRAWRAATHGL